ncbi:MAG: hypothetical protein WC824_06775 [Bacteroidota bacterium]|jgi:hypothetical protein
MPLHGQASGGWTESSSALRILNLGVRNSIGVLTDDAFTQTNPTAVATVGTVSTRLDQTLHGVLSGSVAFCRPDAGEDFVGGPGDNTTQGLILANTRWRQGYRPLGVFINSANGNAFENTPGVASGIGPYVCAMGTYGNALYETQIIGTEAGATNDPVVGSALAYVNGQRLISSRNGFLMPATQLTVALAIISCDSIACTAEGFVFNADNVSTLIGVLKMAPDATQTELVYDARL